MFTVTSGLGRACLLLTKAALEANEPDEAVSYLRILHKLRQACCFEAGTTGPDRANSQMNFLANGVYQGINTHQWSAEHLSYFALIPAGFDPTAEWLQGVRFDTAWVLDQVSRVGSGDGRYTLELGAFEVQYRQLPKGWLLQNQAYWIRESLSRNMLPLKSGSLEAWHIAAQAPLPRRNLINEMSCEFLRLNSLPRVALYQRACVQLYELAVALERYFLKHRRYPETLEVIAPEFIAAIPKDFDGASMRYSVTSDGQRFKVWSVGIDKVDDWMGIRPGTEKPRAQPDSSRNADYLLDIWAPVHLPPSIPSKALPKRGPKKSK